MPNVTESSKIAGVLIVEPDVHGDERGRFSETYRRQWIADGREMVQANLSTKQAGAIVGLHYHRFQADYWFLLEGTMRIVLHDLRQGSPTDGATQEIDVVATEPRGVYIPPGVAHGFASHSDMRMWYLVDGYYDPEDELGVAWDDPDVAADWGVTDPILSGRDQANPRRADLKAELTPRFGPRR